MDRNKTKRNILMIRSASEFRRWLKGCHVVIALCKQCGAIIRQAPSDNTDGLCILCDKGTQAQLEVNGILTANNEGTAQGVDAFSAYCYLNDPNGIAAMQLPLGK